MSDEVGALVLDIGSQSVRAGFAGEDTPKVDIPSYVAVPPIESEKKVIVGTNITVPRDSYQIESFLKDGMIDNFDHFENIVSHVIDTLVPNEKSHHPILISEPVWNTKAKRDKITEVLFETFKAPAIYFAKNAVLTCFANGRHTGLVLDCGSIHSTAIPVYEGMVMTQATVRSPLGGDFLLKQCQKLLENYHIPLVPIYKVGSKEQVKEKDPARWTPKSTLPNVTDSYDEYMKKQLLTDFLASVVQVSDDKYDQNQAESFPTVNYEFPTGFNMDFTYERFRIAENLFDPAILPETKGNSMLSMSHTVTSSISLCDIDIRPSMYSNILVVGGLSSILGFGDRLQKDLNNKTPSSLRVKVNLPASVAERRFSSWIGGSILGSLGTFQQLWISKQEYEENGKAIIDKKTQ
ncbi:Actin-like 6A [Cichlidogyrus casuarinus]|uniref:Actin-like 6A n=1 Tax=Cichlidogyrus casuarinus TaxID=1844966 RepID=A0ABD2Q4Y4_9PLAT